MEDKQIVDLFWDRSETAISETDKKYGRYCHYIAYQILSDDEDAKEITNDTYLKTWNSIPPNRPNSLKGYLAKLCSRLALNRYEERNTSKRGGGQLTLVLDELAECISGQESGAEIVDAIALRDALNQFLWSLPQKTRNIFVRRYWYVSSLAEIARDYSMTESAVAMLMLRTREKLKNYLEKEGFEL